MKKILILLTSFITASPLFAANGGFLFVTFKGGAKPDD